MEVKQYFPETSKVHESSFAKSRALFTFVKCPEKEVISKKIDLPGFEDAKWWFEIREWKASTAYPAYFMRSVIMCLDIKDAFNDDDPASTKGAAEDEKISRKFYANFNVTLENPTSVVNKKSVKFELVERETRFVKDMMHIYCDPNGSSLPADYVKVKTKSDVDLQLLGEVEILSTTTGYEAESVEKFGVTPVPMALPKLLESGDFFDFTFIVSAKKFPVHKCILSLASPVFARMFHCDLDEKKQNFAKTDDDPEIFQMLLEFIYSGKLPKNFARSALGLYEMAHMYQMDQLMEYCMGHIMAKRIDSKNALELYQFARSFDVQPLISRTWDFIRYEMLRIFKPLNRDPFTMEEIDEYMTMTETYQTGISRFFRKSEVECKFEVVNNKVE